MTRSEEKTVLSPEEYARVHQKSFRVAFDFLSAHFPPGADDAWWDQTAKDMGSASVSAGENKLVIELLIAVMNYLSEEHKRRKDDGETAH